MEIDILELPLRGRNLRRLSYDFPTGEMGLFAFAGARGSDPEAGEGLAEVLQEGFRIVDIRVAPDTARRGNGFDFVQLEFVGEFFHSFGLAGAPGPTKAFTREMLTIRLMAPKNCPLCFTNCCYSRTTCSISSFGDIGINDAKPHLSHPR